MEGKKISWLEAICTDFINLAEEIGMVVRGDYYLFKRHITGNRDLNEDSIYFNYFH